MPHFPIGITRCLPELKWNIVVVVIVVVDCFALHVLSFHARFLHSLVIIRLTPAEKSLLVFSSHSFPLSPNFPPIIISPFAEQRAQQSIIGHDSVDSAAVGPALAVIPSFLPNSFPHLYCSLSHPSFIRAVQIWGSQIHISAADLVARSE